MPRISRDRKVHRLNSSVPVLALLLLLSFAFNWNYLRGGFQSDEFFFLNTMRDDPSSYSRFKGFWAFEDLSSLSNLWWFEGGGEMDVFWRPVPSLFIEGSVRLFGEVAFPLHLLSLLVHGLVAGTLFLLVRRLTRRHGVAILAAIVFLSCEDHSMGVGWIAAVTDLICALFVNLSLIAHAAWLSSRRRWQVAASLTAMALALLSKESAVVGPLALILMTMLLPKGRDEELPEPSVSTIRLRWWAFLRDWPSWVPSIVLLVIYLTAYRLIGFGGISTGLYVDPLSEPVRFVSHLTLHLPLMWLATLSPVPPSVTMFMPLLGAPLAMLGVLAFLGLAAGLWFLRRQALVVWALAVYLMALLPQMSTDASERGLYLPSVTASLLLALLIVQIRPIARRVTPAASRAPLPTRLAGWAALLCVLIPGIVLSAIMPFLYLPSNEKIREEALTAVPHIEARNPDYALLLNTSGFFQTFYPSTIIDFYTSKDVDVRVLSALNGVVSVQRLDDRSFTVRTDRAGWLTNLFGKMLRPPGSLTPGRVYEKDPVTASFVEMTADGGDVLAVRFEIDRPLDDPSLLFLQWNGEAFIPVDLAELPPGESVTLADTSDVWASLW